MCSLRGDGGTRTLCVAKVLAGRVAVVEWHGADTC
eukprot:COSAG06_NODE_41888_length_386_cov_20.867596_1_plen_34_part_10